MAPTVTRNNSIALALAGLVVAMVGLTPDRASAAPLLTATAASDVFIRGDGPKIDSTALSVSEWEGAPTNLSRHTLISFDLSSFITIQTTGFSSATLMLGVPVTGTSGTHTVRRLLRDFSATVDWDEYTSGSFWQTPGAVGANDSVTIATGVASGTTTGTHWANGGLNVTAAANAWFASGDTTNLNFLILPETHFIHYSYGSSESLLGPGPGPVLVFALLPEPGAGMVVALGLIAAALRRRRLRDATDA